MHYGKPIEGIWSVLKGGALANLAVASFAHLVQVVRHGLKKIQYRPSLIRRSLCARMAGRWAFDREHRTVSNAVEAADLVILLQAQSAFDLDDLASHAQVFLDTRGASHGGHRL